MSAASTPLALAWVALVVGAGWRWRPSPATGRLAASSLAARHDDRADRADHAGSVDPSVGGRPASAGPRPRRLLGAVASGAGRLGRRLARRPPDPVADLRLGRALGAASAGALVAVPLGVAAGLAVWILPAWHRRREAMRLEAAVSAELPEVVDLFVLAAGGGLNVSLAVAAVGGRAPPAIGTVLRRAAEHVEGGARAADALEEALGRLGDPVRPLLAALVASERYGAALVPGLERLAGEVRLGRRRRAEEAARRVPVRLLFPLVLCTLPAFALLTIVPLLAGTLRLLRL